MKFKEEENEYGDKCFTTELDLNILTKLNFQPWDNEGRPTGSSTNFLIQIEQNGFAESPTQSQINTVEYISTNQSELINSMFHYLKDIVYPIFEDSMDIEPEEMIDSANDLNKILGLKEIQILGMDRDNFAYTTYFFDFILDREHGLYFITHKDRVLHFCGQGDLGFDCVSMDQLNLSFNDDRLLKVEVYDEKNNLIATKQSTFKDSVSGDGLEGGIYKFILYNGNYSIEKGLYKK